ncbi:MAG: M48 family metallopeptidase [Candidatus Cryptobacteroides sp.]
MNIDGLEIELESKPIKNMHLSVYPPDGRVHLSIPDYLSEADARSYVISKWEWIRKQQDEIAAQARQTTREYVSGENHYFFGVRYRLKVINTTSGANGIQVSGNSMTMRVRAGSTLERRTELMMEWYREQLKAFLCPLVERWASKLEEPNVSWQVKEMKTMWGSCGVKRRSLLFNLELARVPKECIEYVVVHEFTHLKINNHNKLFEALMTQRLPDWRKLREALNAFIALPL